MIKVFLAGKSHVFFRAIEQLLLEASIKINGSCSNPMDVADEFKTSTADVMLLDARWAGSELTGTGILKHLIKLDPLMKIVLVTTFYELHMANRCRNEKLAKGYLCRHTDKMQSIVQCISEVAAGGTFFLQ